MIIDIKEDILIKSLDKFPKIIKIEDNYIPQKRFVSMLITFNKIKVLEHLIKKEFLQIDIIDVDGRTILYNVIKYNFDIILKMIVEYNKNKIGISLENIKDKDYNTSLFYCIIFNRFDMFKYLIENNFDPYHKNKNRNNCFNIAIKLNRNRFLDYLFNKYDDFTFVNKNQETFLYQILQSENLKFFNILIKKKIDINLGEIEYNITPLIITIVNDLNDEFNTLLNCPKIKLEKSDKYGNTCLHYAILENNYKFITKIINKMNIFNYQNLNGVTPFHLLIQKNDLFHKLYKDDKKLFDKFVDNTNFNLVDNDGKSIAFNLIKNNTDDITIDILKKKKINPFIQNLDGIDIIDLIKIDNKLMNIFIKKYYNSLTIPEKKDLDNWERHCLEKNYKTLENDYNIKKFTKNFKDEEKCFTIIKRKLLLKEKYRSTKKDRIVKINNGIPMKECYYTGSSIDIIYGLIYLNNSLSEIDILIEYPLTVNKELEEYYSKMNLDYPYKLDFSNFEINWYPVVIFYPSYLDKKLEEYKIKIKNKKNVKRYIVIPISIELSSGNSHANILLIDNIDKEISRFEPHGSSSPDGFYFNEKLLDSNLKNKFINVFTNYKYRKPKTYLPNIGFQSLENLMTNRCKKIGDPNGFCAVWCIWWVYQRIKYSNLDLKTLSEKLINQLKIDKIVIPEMIRNFSNNISKLRDSVLQNNKIDINDWINSNYDNDILDNIEKETFNIIH